MRKKAAESLVVAGAVAILAFLAWHVGLFVWFWFTDVVPQAWERDGNPWPAIVPIALACFIAGMTLLPSDKKD